MKVSWISKIQYKDEDSKQGEPDPTVPVLAGDECTSDASKAPQEWGFVIYRTVYGNDEEWRTFKKKLWKHVERKRDAIGEAGGDPDRVTFDFIEDEPELDGANPSWTALLLSNSD